MNSLKVLLAAVLWIAPSYSALAEPTPSILFIGDSHTVGTFGVTLDTLLRSREGTRVKTVGSCGLSPNGFLDGLKTQCGLKVYELDQKEISRSKAPTPTIDELLAEIRPTLTVIALGANQIDTATSSPAAQKQTVESLVAKVRDAGSDCIWVGPPHGRNKPEPKFSNLYRLLMEGVGNRCVFFDSRPGRLPFLHYERVAAEANKLGDGRHYDALGEAGRTAVRRWALEAYRAIEPLVR